MHFVLTTPSFTLTANFSPCLVWSICKFQTPCDTTMQFGAFEVKVLQQDAEMHV